MTRHPRTVRRGLLGAPACALALVLTGCGTEPPSTTVGPEVPGGAVGPDAPASEALDLLQVQLEYPADGVYEVGEDASLYLGISNSGNAPAVLTGVSGPDFADARSSGAATTTGDLAIEVPAADTVYVGAEDEPSITLVGLEESLRSSQSIPVTFTFDDGQEVTIEAMVAEQPDDPAAPFDFTDPDDDPSDG